MKRILTIILAAITFAACDPNETKLPSFKAEDLVSTRWEGTLQNIQGGATSGSSAVTLIFNTTDSGQMIQKRSGSPAKDKYDMTYTVSGKKITFDCPIISGTWEATNYNEKGMTLMLLPSRNSLMTLVRQ